MCDISSNIESQHIVTWHHNKMLCYVYLHENYRLWIFTKQINNECIISFKQLLAKSLTIQALYVLSCLSVLWITIPSIVCSYTLYLVYYCNFSVITSGTSVVRQKNLYDHQTFEMPEVDGLKTASRGATYYEGDKALQNIPIHFLWRSHLIMQV